MGKNRKINMHNFSHNVTEQESKPCIVHLILGSLHIIAQIYQLTSYTFYELLIIAKLHENTKNNVYGLDYKHKH